MNHNGFKSIESIIYPQNKFNLDTLFHERPMLRSKIGSNGRERRLTTSIFSLDVFSEEKNDRTDITILGLIKNVRTYRTIPLRFLEEHPNMFKYKVIVPKSNGTGAIGEVLSTPLIGEPLIGVTQSFISFGAFDKKSEAVAAYKYICSKFARVMLGILKVTQDNSKETWKFVPMQDFTDNSDIDWSKSIEEIDRQLYKKYELDQPEIDFIEKMIKPMD